MSFLPTTYSKIPSNSDYMKLLDGDNNFRVLSSAVVGYIYWNTQNKPIRSRERWDSIPDDCKQEKDGTFKVSHFWAFVVWNYEEKRVQLLEITQKSIMTQLKAYVDNPRWGDPKQYDITINRSGTGFDTAYLLQANPPIAPADEEILSAYAKKQVNLDAMFEAGGDPFAVKGTESKSKEPEYVPVRDDVKAAEEEPLPIDPLGDMSPADRATFHSAFDKPGVPGVAPQK